jgi:hypothetical protein
VSPPGQGFKVEAHPALAINAGDPDGMVVVRVVADGRHEAAKFNRIVHCLLPGC